MGQYFMVVNKTRKEYIYGHPFGHGIKFSEHKGNNLMMEAFLHLIASGGRWAGNEVELAGDYAKEEHFKAGSWYTLYEIADMEFKDISYQAMSWLCSMDFDYWQRLALSIRNGGNLVSHPPEFRFLLTPRSPAPVNIPEKYRATDTGGWPLEVV